MSARETSAAARMRACAAPPGEVGDHQHLAAGKSFGVRQFGAASVRHDEPAFAAALQGDPVRKGMQQAACRPWQGSAALRASSPFASRARQLARGPRLVRRARTGNGATALPDRCSSRPAPVRSAAPRASAASLACPVSPAEITMAASRGGSASSRIDLPARSQRPVFIERAKLLQQRARFSKRRLAAVGRRRRATAYPERPNARRSRTRPDRSAREDLRRREGRQCRRLPLVPQADGDAGLGSPRASGPLVRRGAGDAHRLQPGDAGRRLRTPAAAAGRCR